MQYVFSTGNAQGQENHKPARKIFAILALLDKVSSIAGFMVDRIYDEHLPLLRHNEKGANFKLVRTIDGRREDISCFDGWQQKDIQQFDSYQWYMLSPSFIMKGGRASFYKIDNRAIFPWLAYEDAISKTDFSVVRKVQIHRAHHNFPSTASLHNSTGARVRAC